MLKIRAQKQQRHIDQGVCEFTENIIALSMRAPELWGNYTALCSQALALNHQLAGKFFQDMAEAMITDQTPES